MIIYLPYLNREVFMRYLDGVNNPTVKKKGKIKPPTTQWKKM